MSLTYTQYVATIANLMGNTATTQTEFVQILPQMIDTAELRILRDMDLLSTIVRDSSGATSSNQRNFTLPTSLGRFVTIDGINVITPANTAATLGTRKPLVAVSRDVLDLLWPSNTAASTSTVPTQFAMITDQDIILGPPPGSVYYLEVIGTIRPTSLSASNPTTYLSLYFPDMLVAASMIFAAGYQKNYGSGVDDPRQAVYWESEYEKMLAGANIEESRKRFSAASWTSKRIEPSAVPQRG